MTTKTEQNKGITLINTSSEGTGGFGISYSSRKMCGKVLNFILIKCAYRFKGQICKKPSFSEFYGIVLAICYVQSLYYFPYENIVFNDQDLTVNIYPRSVFGKP